MAAGSQHNSAVQRLRNDYMRIKRDPVPYIVAEPLQNNILEWHYVVFGPEKTPYEGGVYHGKLIFPREFPFKPPSIYMLTPNGRFACGQRLCLSISDFHPDTWNPAWSVSTILTGLLSFMLETTATLGSLETSDAQKREFARQSVQQNLRDPLFRSLFPEIVAQLEAKRLRNGQNCRVNKDGGQSNDSVAETQTNRGAAHSLVTNLAILACVAVFAFAVRYILSTLS